MKTFIAFLSLLLSINASAHEFYFGFAEVEYNEISRKYEVTLVMSTHDMEKAFNEELEMSTGLDKITEKSEEISRIENYLRQHFKLGQTISSGFHLLGLETMTNGITHFYLESEPLELSANLEWKFDLLMNHFPEQQNKLTFYFRDQQYTTTFLPTSPIQMLKLEIPGL